MNGGRAGGSLADAASLSDALAEAIARAERAEAQAREYESYELRALRERDAAHALLREMDLMLATLDSFAIRLGMFETASAARDIRVRIDRLLGGLR